MSNILDEIPYIVNARKDTGLFNSKIAIWLFLASEVMLFGGLFSGYIFLRIYADYPWPERALPITPGFINTFVLIGSSVTVVFAWASLKMRKYRQFQIYMAITLVCAVIFMVLKGFEYSAKFSHKAVRLTDSFAMVEGHLSKEKDANGNKHYVPYEINFETEALTVDVNRFHAPFFEKILKQQPQAFTLTNQSIGAIKQRIADESVARDPDEGLVKDLQAIVDSPALSVETLATLKEIYRDTRSDNAVMKTAALRKAWEVARVEHAGLSTREMAPLVKVDTEALDPFLVREIQSVSFKTEEPVALTFAPNDLRDEADQATLKDDTLLKGKRLASDYILHVDTLDFRHVAMRAHERDLDPMDVINNSWVVSANPEIKKVWEAHLEWVAGLRKELEPKGQEPNENDLYRVTWQEMVKTLGYEEKKPGPLAGFTGPKHYDGSAGYKFPQITIPRERIAFESNLTPKWNTYYAIYFLITGLHGLHVIGGAIVLGYFGFCSKKMYDENPEWLANRVEVGGLFWHFVDLVWIFLFPIMYLM